MTGGKVNHTVRAKDEGKLQATQPQTSLTNRYIHREDPGRVGKGLLDLEFHLCNMSGEVPGWFLPSKTEEGRT